MSEYSITKNRIIALAYFHRYGWIATMVVCMLFWPYQMFYTMGIGMLIFALWSFIGYKRKWRHIYCSYQNAYHQKMTPHSVSWNQIRKGDAYGVPLIFFVLGLAMLCFAILR